MPSAPVRLAMAALAALALGLLLWGCGGGVRVVREGPDAGVALYVYKGRGGHLRSSNRPAASARMREFCHGPYRVIREGRAKGRHRVIENPAGTEEVMTEQWWGIRFRCGAADGSADGAANGAAKE